MNESHISSQRLNLDPCPIHSSEGLIDNIKSKKYDFWNEETFKSWIDSKKQDIGKICNLCIRVQKNPNIIFNNTIKFGSYLGLDGNYGKSFISSKFIIDELTQYYTHSKKIERKKDEDFPVLICYMDLSSSRATREQKDKAFESFYKVYNEVFNNSSFKTDWEKCGNSYWDYIERAVKNNEEACGFCVYI